MSNKRYPWKHPRRGSSAADHPCEERTFREEARRLQNSECRVKRNNGEIFPAPSALRRLERALRLPTRIRPDSFALAGRPFWRTSNPVR